ncbi:MAG: PIN domain-containing protein [Candidatus Methylomirabilales bacterium]
MPGFLPDTSCMVAAVCAWHEHHERVAQELERRLSHGEAMLIAAPALVETYAVLTRLPPPHRLSPADALVLLEANFMGEAKTVALDANSYRTLLRQASRDGIAGGRTYDLVIAACAFKVRAAVLLTLNPGHFLPFSRKGLEIVVPGEPRR